MELELLIEDYGYAALFFSLCLGLFGFPMPNEAIVMTSGAVTSSGLLLPLPAFAMTYLGVCSGLTFGFAIGRIFGLPLLMKLKKMRGFEQGLERTERLIHKYGSYALVFGYFIPFVRHIMPYVVSSNRMSYIRFAPFAYTGGLLWTSVYFLAGRAVTAAV
ncbi:DedA family protein [Paenibacillus thermotolerans]|uniref:DedA family protein n=1 Tax=Paenibacillus thermotolerans TaxID=3027807 RepID=UPI002368204B|nr:MULTISPECIES: DedA family protein [unclassified Paenibacillus]